MVRDHISSGLLFLVAVLTVAEALTGLDWTAYAAVALLLLFIVLEYRFVPPVQRIVGSALVVIGAATALATDDIMLTLFTGLHRALPFILLFASVAWLQVPSAQSPSLLAVREVVLVQPPGRRFAWVAGTAHFLGIAFNLAGLSLLTPMVAKGAVPGLQKRLARAMVQGFGAGTCWSPLYVGTALIIASVPGVEWSDVGPTGFVIGMILLLWSWLVDRLILRPRNRAPASPDVAGGPMDTAGNNLTLQIWARLASILISLFGCIIFFVEALGWSIPIALAVTAPLFSVVWVYVISRHNDINGPVAMARKVILGLSGLRGEVILFSGANIVGVSVSAVVPELLGKWLVPGMMPPAVSIVAVMAGYAITSFMGLHPVVTVVLVTSILTPEMLGIPPEVLALALMVMWGQGTNASPFSATVLYMARITGVSGLTVAWRWNLPIVLTTTVLLAAIMIGLNAVGYFG